MSTQRQEILSLPILKKRKETKKENTDIAIAEKRLTKLHGEVSRVVIFYCGDDCLDKLEENQKIPESFG